MDREYLEDYFQKETEELESYIKGINEGKYSFERSRFPADNRFINIQKPVALVVALERGSLWTQVPFSGSSIIKLCPWSPQSFEGLFFKISDIPKVVDFIKETGKIQVMLAGTTSEFAGLDYLDPIFQELKPPISGVVPLSAFWKKKEIENARATFFTLARVKYIDFHKSTCPDSDRHLIDTFLYAISETYATLKVGGYTLVEEIENMIIDDPLKATVLLEVCSNFIETPFRDTRSDIYNYPLDDVRETQHLPLVYQPQKVRFPFEIGKFLLGKLTYAPQGLRACNDIIDHYDAYELQKVQESLNDAIVTNHPEVVRKSADEFSEILDNVWSDPTIPRRIKGLKIGIPLLLAAIGSVAAGPIGATGGFLAGLGFDVLSKSIEIGTENLSEKLVKLGAKSYQANIYDFKKKYKGKIRTD